MEFICIDNVAVCKANDITRPLPQWFSKTKWYDYLDMDIHRYNFILGYNSLEMDAFFIIFHGAI